MRFRAEFGLLEQSILRGTIRKVPGTSCRENDCHEFTVKEVEYDMTRVFYNSVYRATVTLVAGRILKNTLVGPASSLATRTIIYPCEYHSCIVHCPCKLCRDKAAYCMIDKGSNTCGDCSECKSDYEDHLLFHRANHISCKFCYNVSEHIPCSIFKTP